MVAWHHANPAGCKSNHAHSSQAMLRRRDPGPWDERVAPTLLGVLLITAIVTNFGLKLYDIYNPN